MIRRLFRKLTGREPLHPVAKSVGEIRVRFNGARASMGAHKPIPRNYQRRIEAWTTGALSTDTLFKFAADDQLFAHYLKRLGIREDM